MRTIHRIYARLLGYFKEIDSLWNGWQAGRQSVAKGKRTEMTEHKALSAFEQAKLQEEGEALKLRVARLVDTLHKIACLGNGGSYGNSIGNVMAQDALSAEAGQQWLREKQAEALESAAKWFDATEYCAREHGEITAYAENELRRMAAELRQKEG